MSSEIDLEVRLIPVKQIHVLNPRERARKKFAQIIGNIAKLGLKKPITGRTRTSRARGCGTTA